MPRATVSLPRPVPPLTKDIAALAALFITSGTTHLVKPDVFEPLVPAPLRSRGREVVYLSGAAELVCAVGLLLPQTRKAAGLASAALLVGIFPGNVKMATDQAKRAARKQDAGSRAWLAGTLARLPMQLPMIRTALKAAGRL